MGFLRHTPSPSRFFVDKTTEWGTGLREVVEGIEQEPKTLVDRFLEAASTLRSALGLGDIATRNASEFASSTPPWTSITGRPSRSVSVQGNFRTAWLAGGLVKLLDLTRMAAAYPYGITINSWYLDCHANDPATELDADLCSCDSPGTGAMPGANVAVIAALDTDHGNSSATGLATSIAGGKTIYLRINADPVDPLTIWTLIVNFTVNDS